MLIAAGHACKNYGMRQLLNDASLDVDSGDKIGIMGINGTGKSTLLRLLARTEEPDEGTVQRFPRARHTWRKIRRWTSARRVLEQVLHSLPADAREAADYEARADRRAQYPAAGQAAGPRTNAGAKDRTLDLSQMN